MIHDAKISKEEHFNSADSSGSQQAETPRPAKSQSFDQWLFSEKVIKSALYSGAFLMILAGLIFVSTNWERLSWPFKLTIVATQTALTAIAGLMLLRRSTSLRVGGLALIAISAGFAPLNPWLLHHYWLRPALNVDPYLMLCFGAAACSAFYLWLMRQTRSPLFSVTFGLAVSAALAGLSLFITDDLGGLMLGGMATAFTVLLLAQAARSWQWVERPLRMLAHVEAIGILLIIIQLLTDQFGAGRPFEPSTWLMIAALCVLTLLYACEERWLTEQAFGWLKYVTLLLAIVFATFQLQLPSPYLGLAFAGWAFLFLAAYHMPIQTSRERTFVVSAGLMAFAVLVAALPLDSDLGWTLLALTVYLAACKIVRHDNRWLYAAIWLLILPTGILGAQFASTPLHYALWFAALLLFYVVLSRRAKHLEFVLLPAAALLSALTIGVGWSGVWWGCVALLVAIGLLYAGYARRWPQLALAVVGVMQLIGWRVSLWAVSAEITPNPFTPYILSFAAIGFVLTLAAICFPQRHTLWRALCYVAGALNLAIAYVIAQTITPPTLAITLSFLLAALFLCIAWRERDLLLQLKYATGALTGLALILVQIGHFQIMVQYPSGTGRWPIVTVSLCASFVLLGLTMRKKLLHRLYGQPLNLLGIGLMLIPLAASIQNRNIFATVAAIAGGTILIDGWRRSQAQPWRIYQNYAAVGLLLAALSSLLVANNVTNLQAYALPIGLALVIIGWNERRRNVMPLYRAFTMAGLLLLFGSAFYQSVAESNLYGYLLLAESVIAVRWGIVTKSRGYVQLGIIALVVNGVTHFGGTFADLPRFVQVGSIGSVLLAGGLIGLFQREKLLATQDAWKREWAKWNP